MALKSVLIDTFQSGTITRVGDENIPKDAASDTENMWSLGDKVELVRGSSRLGDNNTTDDEVLAVFVGTDIDGNEYIYKQSGTTLYYLNSSDVWTSVQTGFTAGEELSFAQYRSPAGSFIWFSSRNTGLYRINLANPTTVHDFYDTGTPNYRGRITIQDNRMWVWDILNNETLLRMSWIDNDFPYTNIASETIDTGNGSNDNFTGQLAQDFIVGRSISITDTVETFTDDGNGTLTGDQGGSGTINYTTGAYDITFNSAPAGAQDIDASYDYEQPKSEGVADFDFTSSTRVAGEGLFLPQFDNNSPIQNVFPFDQNFYIPHTKSTWIVNLKEDDTDATNKIFRSGTGMKNWQAAAATGEGIVYVDTAQEEDIKVRILGYDKVNTKVVPRTLSDAIDLNDYNFDDGFVYEFGELILVACASDDTIGYNDTIWIYNTRLQTWDKRKFPAKNFTTYEGDLYAGSSVNGNVYKLFHGISDDDAEIKGSFTSADMVLDSQELKRFRRLTVEGDIAEGQELIVEASYDGGAFEELFRIEGDGEYVDANDTTEYGVVQYGTQEYGGGGALEAARYFRRYKLNTPKFYRFRYRIRTNGYGYFNLRQMRIDDIRMVRQRAPSKFRVKA